MEIVTWILCGIRNQLEGLLRPIPYTPGVVIRRWFYWLFYGGVRINVRDHAFVTHIHNIDIDPTSFIGRCADVNAAGGLKIGKHVGFAPYVIIRTQDHQYDNRDMVLNRTSYTFGAPIEIGDGAWIGARAIILKGVKVGRYAVVGAGSVVTKDVPDEHIAVGNPARVIKKITFKDDLAREAEAMAEENGADSEGIAAPAPAQEPVQQA